MKPNTSNKISLYFVLILFLVLLGKREKLYALNPSVYLQVQQSPQDSIQKYKELSINAHRAGKLEEFKGYSEKLLKIATDNDLIDDRISALVYLAIYHQQIDEYDQSLSRYFEAEKLSQSLPENSFSKILVQVNMGNLYNHIEDYEKVKLTMKRVIELAPYHKNPENIISSAYNSIGTANLNQGNYEEALSYMNKVKNLATDLNRNDQIIGALINIAECQRYLKRYDMAISNAEKAISRTNDNESRELIASANVIIGICRYMMHQPEKALQPLLNARDIATDGNFLDIKMEAHQYLSKSYETLNRIKKSLEEQKSYIETREKYLKTLSKAKRLKFEEEAKSKSKIIKEQQQSLKSVNRKSKVFLYIGLVLFCAFMLSIFLYLRYRKIVSQQALELKNNQALLEDENVLLKDKLQNLAIKLEEQDRNEISKDKTAKKRSSLSVDEEEYYMKKILDYMEFEKPYLDHEIKQSDIANKLDMSLHLFSEVLNVCFKRNFNSFINLYRVNKAKQLIQDPNYTDYKILAIGYEAGFPSKTSFNRVFKNFVGLTPTEYQKQQQML